MDVIHTDTEHMFHLIVGGTGYGLFEPCGHKDFYPNGGVDQPGCDRKRRVKRVDVTRARKASERMDLSKTCSHGRSLELFSASIDRGCVFLTRRCDDWKHFKSGACNGAATEIMGYDATPPKDPSTRMTMYFKTGAKYPFCLGQAGSVSSGSKFEMKEK